MTVIVRPARHEDYAAIAAVGAALQALHAAGRPDVFRSGGVPLSERHFAAYLADDPPAVYVAERHDAEGANGDDARGDRAVGVVGYVLLSAYAEPSNAMMHRRMVATVEQIGVLATERGQGAGRALMAHAQAWAQERGADVLRLHVWEFNDHARAFYAHIGMATASRFMEMPLSSGHGGDESRDVRDV